MTDTPALWIQIGTSLRNARQAQGYTRLQVAQMLYIREQYLHALEEGTLTALLPAVYVRGYVQRYAALLEMDGDYLLKPVSHTTAHLQSRPATPTRAGVTFTLRYPRTFLWTFASVLMVMAVITYSWWHRPHVVPLAPVPEALMAHTQRILAQGQAFACYARNPHSLYPFCIDRAAQHLLMVHRPSTARRACLYTLSCQLHTDALELAQWSYAIHTDTMPATPHSDAARTLLQPEPMLFKDVPHD